MIVKKWEQFGTVLVGKYHKESNKPCQDRIFYKKENDTHVIALADGAGSKSRSGIGAEIAVKTACSLIIERFDDYMILLEENSKSKEQLFSDSLVVKREILQKIIFEIKLNNKEPLQEFSSTLLFAAIKGEKCLFGHIGDGVIGAILNDGALKVISAPENGGAPNITFFVTDNDAEKHLRLISSNLNEIKGIILMSDGVEEAMYTPQGLIENTKRVFLNKRGVKSEDYNKVLERFLSKQISKISGDDLSLNLLYFEDADSETADKSYMDYLFEGISEMVSISSYSYILK